jgi:hypothetical protein
MYLGEIERERRWLEDVENYTSGTFIVAMFQAGGMLQLRPSRFWKVTQRRLQVTFEDVLTRR